MTWFSDWRETVRNNLKNGRQSFTVLGSYGADDYVGISEFMDGTTVDIASVTNYGTDKPLDQAIREQGANPSKFEGKELWITLNGHKFAKASFNFKTKRNVQSRIGTDNIVEKKQIFKWEVENANQKAEKLAEQGNLNVPGRVQTILGQDAEDTSVSNFNDLLKASRFPALGMKFTEPHNTDNSTSSDGESSKSEEKEKRKAGLVVGVGVAAMAGLAYIGGEL